MPQVVTWPVTIRTYIVTRPPVITACVLLSNDQDMFQVDTLPPVIRACPKLSPGLICSRLLLGLRWSGHLPSSLSFQRSQHVCICWTMMTCPRLSVGLLWSGYAPRSHPTEWSRAKLSHGLWWSGYIPSCLQWSWHICHCPAATAAGQTHQTGWNLHRKPTQHHCRSVHKRPLGRACHLLWSQTNQRGTVPNNIKCCSFPVVCCSFDICRPVYTQIQIKNILKKKKKGCIFRTVWVFSSLFSFILFSVKIIWK